MGDVSLRDFAPIRWKWRIQRLAQRNDASGALLFILSPSFGFGGIEGERIPKVPAVQNARDILASRLDLFQFPQSELQGAATHHGLVESEVLCSFDFVCGFHLWFFGGFLPAAPARIGGSRWEQPSVESRCERNTRTKFFKRFAAIGIASQIKEAFFMLRRRTEFGAEGFGHR